AIPTLSILGATILDFGTPEQQRRYLPPMFRGEHLWVQMLSEPHRGSDLARARTKAVRDGGTWVLSGTKIWTSGALHADLALCLARTNWDVPKHRGLTMFIVDLRTKGIDMQPITMVDGTQHFCQEFLDEVSLPADAVLGEVDQGW